MCPSPPTFGLVYLTLKEIWTKSNKTIEVSLEWLSDKDSGLIPIQHKWANTSNQRTGQMAQDVQPDRAHNWATHMVQEWEKMKAFEGGGLGYYRFDSLIPLLWMDENNYFYFLKKLSPFLKILAFVLDGWKKVLLFLFLEHSPFLQIWLWKTFVVDGWKN